MWSYEEWKLFWEMLNSMPEFSIGEKPVAESVCFDGIHDGKRNTEKHASLYDAMHAEMMDDRNAEKAKVRNRRRADRKHPETKAERKKNEMRRIRRLYGCVWEDGFGWSWEYKSGSKKVPEKDAEIFRNLKERSAEKSARAKEPVEHHVGWSEIERMMYNADKIMREIRAKYAERGAETFDNYWVDALGRSRVYDDEYYYRQYEWNYCYDKKTKGQKFDYADMCDMWAEIAFAELNEWLQYA